ncbi:MAG: peptidyl-prolyl cis-trans isomerase [Epsilonproteobacteria bacterium]|nr:peptidyl-prolyl cis-trans isomerase [Campylobacterota bacterium]
MKKIIPLLLFAIIGLQAQEQIIDAIAIDVDGEPITTLEIQAVQKKLNMSKKAAIEALINDRLEKGAIEKANITIEPSEIDAKIQQIATTRGMTKAQMRVALNQKGLTWEAYKEQLGMELKKEKFFQQQIASSLSQPTEDELKTYYETHKEKFSSVASTVQMSLIAYASNASKKLQEAMQNPMKKVAGVQQKNLLVNSSEMAPQLFQVIQNTPEGSFTQPINTGQGFVAYYVKSKGQGQGGFESVKNAVAMQWIQEERAKAGSDFINKLKSNANIRVIRL